MRHLTVEVERWPIRGGFAISRGRKTAAEVVVVEIAEGPHVGRGEAVPYGRYGETLDGVVGQINGVAAAIDEGLDRPALAGLLPAGAARNAVDCALWDLEAKRAGRPVWALAGLPEPATVDTAYTLSVDTPEAMAAAARAAAHRPLLKLKLAGDGDVDRVRAVRAQAPDSRLIVDANEAWTVDHLRDYGPILAKIGVEMIEQPLPADVDDGLTTVRSPVPICADESCHDTTSLGAVLGKYQMINVKLDKAGGLTEALRLIRAAEGVGMPYMIGCMVATSLAMAPALLMAQRAAFVDLDGPLLLDRDREPGLRFDGSRVQPAPGVWGDAAAGLAGARSRSI